MFGKPVICKKQACQLQSLKAWREITFKGRKKRKKAIFVLLSNGFQYKHLLWGAYFNYKLNLLPQLYGRVSFIKHCWRLTSLVVDDEYVAKVRKSGIKTFVLLL